MEFNKALDTTFVEFGINAKALAGRVGVHPQTISDYRRGRRDVGSENLKKIIDGLQLEEKRYFYRLAGAPTDLLDGDIWKQLDHMSVEELSQLMVVIAQRIPQITRQRELQNV